MAKFTRKAIMNSLLELLKTNQLIRLQLKIYVMTVKLTEILFIIITRIYMMY